MPQVQGVLVREDVLSAERRVDPDVERLGEGDQLLPRAAGPLTGYNYGATSLFQKAGDVLDLLRVGSRPGRR